MTLTIGGGTLNANMTAVGVSVADVAVYIDASATKLDAVGTFAWLNTGEITNCALGGTTTMTLTGVLLVLN